jgi:hypothetical protein
MILSSPLRFFLYDFMIQPCMNFTVLDTLFVLFSCLFLYWDLERCIDLLTRISDKG